MNEERLTAALVEIKRIAETCRDEEAGCRKIAQICKIALGQAVESQEVKSIGRQLLEDATQTIIAEDVADNATEMAAQMAAEELASENPFAGRTVATMKEIRENMRKQRANFAAKSRQP